MSFLNRLFGWGKNQIQGDIGYYQLENWWLESFTDEERKIMESIYTPLGSDSEYSLTRGKIFDSSQTKVQFLTNLAGWFKRPQTRHLANKIIEKAEEVATQNTNDILGIHFLYSEMVGIYYPQRSNEEIMNKAIEACKKQIAMASEAARAFKKEYPGEPLSGHTGYEQLVIILDKQGKHQEAIELCKQAHNQGWGGDWDKRVSRYKKKIS